MRIGIAALALVAVACARPPPGPLRAPFVTTPPDVVRAMLELARVDDGDLVYDLGCGDGRVVVAAARDYGARAVGFDIDPERVAESRANVQAAGVADRVRIERADVFELDLRPASVVTLFLLQALNDRLVPQLEQLAPGTRIISHRYRLRGVRPPKEVRMVSREDHATHTLFLWVVPFEGRRAREQADGAAAVGGF
ncbi:MAG: methyltransferase domain-containing protein [Myxococcota bacterium]